MRALLLAAAAACSLSGAAHASVIYKLVNPTYNDFANSASGGGANGATLNLSFEISNEAVRRGSFGIDVTYGGQPGQPAVTLSGNVADFVSFTDNAETVTQATAPGNLSLRAFFDAAGNVTSFSETYSGFTEESRISGSSSMVSGTFGSDRFATCGSTNCSVVSGQLAATLVPEPGSIALLGAGLLAMAYRRRNSQEG